MVTLLFHFKVDELGDTFWEIDSPDLPGVKATAPQLRDCRRLVLEKTDAAGIRGIDLCFVFAEEPRRARYARA